MSRKQDDSDLEEFDWVKVKAQLDAIGHEESATERFKRKFADNPLVPTGCLLTAGALTYGLISFRKGDSGTSQLMMRYRIAAQGFTVAALIGGIAMAAMKSTGPT